MPATPVTARLRILEPATGATVTDRAIVVRGTAPPGASITRDIPFWFDEHTTADSVGAWSFAVTLNEGENVFTFRLGDDVATEQTLVVFYAPN